MEDIKEALKFADENKLQTQVLSGGSNIIFPDKGFDGAVLKIDFKGIVLSDSGKFTLVKIKAGENWDEVVQYCVKNDLSGIECLSGIPGSAGAAPIQNIGAYGQEVKDTISSVEVLDRNSYKIIKFTNEECKFNYRLSRFKAEDKDRFIITEVTFRLKKSGEPAIKYDELQKYIDTEGGWKTLRTRKQKLFAIRNAVISIRKKKSMIIDSKDPNSRSCGSFFINPVLNKKDFDQLKEKFKENNFPFYKSGEAYKIPAAWLVEHGGFNKGFRKGNAGISINHSLAIINFGNNTTDVLTLANDIEKSVFEKFGIKLQREPEIVDQLNS